MQARIFSGTPPAGMRTKMDTPSSECQALTFRTRYLLDLCTDFVDSFQMAGASSQRDVRPTARRKGEQVLRRLGNLPLTRQRVGWLRNLPDRLVRDDFCLVSVVLTTKRHNVYRVCPSLGNALASVVAWDDKLGSVEICFI